MKPIILMILDGFGIRKEIHGNAVKQGNTPNFDFLWNNYPHSLLEASGELVGLPEGQMGNSEVGHTNIGAGRIVEQPLAIINKSIKDKSIYDNKELNIVLDHVKNNNSKLHIMGLLSDGGVHSHIDHIISLIDIVKEKGIKKLYIHPFLDGRDTGPQQALSFLKQLEEKIASANLGVIATLSGRYYAMDRDNNWERTKKVYEALVKGEGNYYSSPYEVVKDSYEKGIYDEFIMPSLINKNGLINEGDGIIHANFRTDRATQLLKAFLEPNFDKFTTTKLNNIKGCAFKEVSNFKIMPYMFETIKLKNKLGEYLDCHGYGQLRIAETEKYNHVTFFFDGLEQLNLKHGDMVLVPSPKVKTYDLQPEMSAYKVTDELITRLESNKYDIIILNYANADMVGHTGNMEAAIEAIETVDICLGKIYNKIKNMNGTLIVTADHGNAEYMLDDNDNVVTEHTLNKVPFIICDNSYDVKGGKLGDIAPTILSILGEEPPIEMTGNVLVNKKNIM